MSEIIRATFSAVVPGHGKMRKVERSGLRYMSDSSIRTKPSMDDPSNMILPSSASSNWRSGISTFLIAPRISVNCRRMNLTFSRSMRSRICARETLPLVAESFAFAIGGILVGRRSSSVRLPTTDFTPLRLASAMRRGGRIVCNAGYRPHERQHLIAVAMREHRLQVDAFGISEPHHETARVNQPGRSPKQHLQLREIVNASEFGAEVGGSLQCHR